MNSVQKVAVPKIPEGVRKRMEADWFRAFVHESGHAAMAHIQAIPCHGIFLQQPKIKACTLIEPLPPPSGLSNMHHLFLAAGSAAEQIVLGDYDFEASQEDRRLSGNPQSKAFEEKVKEAEAILLDKRLLITTLAQKLGNMVKKASGDFTSFRVQKVDAGDGITEYWVLLREEELKKELKGHL